VSFVGRFVSQARNPPCIMRPVDSSVVNKQIRRIVWPLLRDAGFTQFTTRSAWRYAPTKIDVVNFQSFNSYLAEGIGSTTSSFAIRPGCSFDAIPRRETVERRDGYFRPKEWECHFRLALRKTIVQPDLKREDVWYVDPLGQNLGMVMENAIQTISDVAFSWFDRFNDSNEVLRTLLEDSQTDVGTWGFGNKPSPVRHMMTGYVALALGKKQVAFEHIQAALLSGCFKDLDDNMHSVVHELNTNSSA
jgi:hypothetical protein